MSSQRRSSLLEATADAWLRRELLEVIDAPLFVLDHAGYCLFANAPAARLVGCPRCSTIGLPVSALFEMLPDPPRRYTLHFNTLRDGTAILFEPGCRRASQP